MTSPKRILRWRKDAPIQQAMDRVAIEEPLEIQVETRPVSVTMRTPGHDPELVAGFLLSEGMIHQADDIQEIRPYPRNRDGNSLGVFLKPGVPFDLIKLTRHVFASSSCGLCGKASIQAVHAHFKPVRSRFQVDPVLLAGLPDAMHQVQETFQSTGGLHAAGLFDTTGKLLLCREDVGRHNAVDKVLGHALLERWLPLNRHILLVSGRASFEILQKALSAQVSILCAVGAPSSLAVDFARTSGQTLIGFLRDGRFNAYAGTHRIRRNQPS